jgi:hypothetical protein
MKSHGRGQNIAAERAFERERPALHRAEAHDEADHEAPAETAAREGAAAGEATGRALGTPYGLVPATIGGIVGSLVGGIAAGVAAWKNCTINVTLLHGVSNTVRADVRRANAIYGPQASVSITNTAVDRLSETESDNILGTDGKLDTFTGSTLTAEETALIAHNRTAGRITAYYVPRFKRATLRGEAIRPARFGVSDPSVVIGAATRVLDTLAHELGHVLTNDGGHSSDAANLMASGSIRDFTDNLTDDQISAIRSSPHVS